MWGWLLVAAALGGCSAPPVPELEPWDVVVESVRAPVGASEPGALRCTPKGEACSAVEAGAALREDAVLRVAHGARVALDLGDGRTLSLEGEARVALRRATAELQIEQGLAVLGARGATKGAPREAAPEASAGEASHRAFTLRAAGTTLDRDPRSPARATLRVLDGGPATLLLTRGRLTLRGPGEPLSLRAGDGAELQPERAPVRRIGATLGLERALDEHERTAEAGDEATRSESSRDLTPPGLAPRGLAPRGLGTMSARVPGTNDIVSGVRLSSHKVNVVIHDGLARTEIEEVFQNDDARVLEGRYLFPVPPDATISRLALWVGDELVEGEIVERERAERIFKGIVDDTVRPRDPALLQWVRGSEVSLRVFPLPAKGSRKVLLAYDQVLDTTESEARYLYPLSLGDDRALTVDDFSFELTASDSRGPLEAPSTPGYRASLGNDRGAIAARFEAKRFTPEADLVVAFRGTATSRAPITAFRAPPPRAGAKAEGAAIEPGFVALRFPVRWPEGVPLPEPARHDRALVLDRSQSQSAETLAGEAELAARLLRDLDADERFVLLACDSACTTFPEDGLASPSEATLSEAERWLHAREPGGSSDLAGALVAAAQRLDRSSAGQIVYLGDGAVSAGELSVDSIAARVRPELEARALSLHLLGAGRSVDELTLGGLGRALAASYERVATGAPLAQRATQIALALRSPLLTGATLEAPSSVSEIHPRVLPPLRVGQELRVYARAKPGEEGEIKLRGTFGETAWETREALAWAPASVEERVAPRLWAAAAIADLEASRDPAASAQIVALSTAHHVMSRKTALLVLENDRMFAAFGIARTQPSDGGKQPSLVGSTDSRESQIARELARLDLAMIGARSAPTSTPSRALDTPEVTSAPFGVADGASGGGLGLSGIGEGGGGQGFGQGLGRIGTFSGSSSGEASSVRATQPRVQLGASSVSGRLPPAVIQRIVRQSFGRFRRCYENGLRRDPTLQGKVAVRFLIGPNGEVMSAADGGSSLADAGVIACIVRGIQGLSFPAPESGSVTVTFPIVFAPDGGPPPPRIELQRPTLFPEGPIAAHQPGDETWRTQGEDALEKLRKALRDDERSRQRHEALIRGLLLRGRFPEAFTAAQRFASLDPDLPRARELLAYAAAAQGEGELARTAVDAQVELAPNSIDLHQRAARAFEAAGDERRACAHFRSLLELGPTSDEARYQALRCRARLGDRDAALREANALDKPGPLVKQLLGALASGATPAWDGSRQSPGSIEATLRCADGIERCPLVALLTPSGTIISPWTPASARSSKTSAALGELPEGRTRTLLIGGDPDARGELTLRAAGVQRTFPVTRGGLQTLAITTITSPPVAFGRW